ncbi:MAG: SAM-dependent methyltransferase [Bacteroidales bacterium]|nr:SAM-dependent methyltransferase [Bacteroidales bacterium]
MADSEIGEVFPENNRSIIFSLNEFIVEELKTARRFLRKIGYQKPFEEVKFNILNEHTDLTEIGAYLKNLINDSSIGLLSEAGSPCIADPGSELVKLAHQNGIRVIPLVGPSSILMALIASGFNGQNFVFHGYLPIDKKQRIQKLTELERNIYKLDQTQIFIETPYRNNRMVEAILSACSRETALCIASNITAKDEIITSKKISEWRKSPGDWNKRPVVFLLFK